MAGAESVPQGIKYLPVSVNFDNYKQEFCQMILPHVRPNWEPDTLECHVFQSGVTNMLVAFYLREVGLENSGGDVVLLRINGKGTEKIINRTDEIVAVLALHREGLAPPIFAELQNGLCYGFFQGRSLKLHETTCNRVMMRKVARLMARQHSVSIPDHFKDREPFLWSKTKKLLKCVTTTFSNDIMKKIFIDSIGSIENLRGEMEELKGLIPGSDELAYRVVLCHNDVHSGNIIYNEQTDTLNMVDYEYTAPNYLIFDIANHFCEFSGVESANYNMYPDESTQKMWIQMYLEEAQKLKTDNQDDVNSRAVNSLYSEVNKVVLGCHLLWIVWALYQVQHSPIRFDYLGYAVLRYKEFLKRKAILYHSLSALPMM